jgi:hypothetical protein
MALLVKRGKTGLFHTPTYSPLKLAAAEHRRPSLLVNQSALPKRKLFSNSMSEIVFQKFQVKKWKMPGKRFTQLLVHHRLL